MVRMVKDVINDATRNEDTREACMLIPSDYSAAFNTISRQLIFDILLAMGFPRKAIRMIRNIHEGATCQILMNDVRVKEFGVTSGCPQGCSLSGVLFNISMIPLLVKLNCLSRKTETKPYILKAQKMLRMEGTISMNPIASAYADDIISIIGFDMDMRKPER